MGFFTDFEWTVLEDSININKFNCNPEVLKKKLVKPLKIVIFEPNLHTKKGPVWPTHKMKKKNWGKIRCCQEGARTNRKVKIPKLQRWILDFLKKSVENIIHH